METRSETVSPAQQDRLIQKVQDLYSILQILDGDAQDFVERVMSSRHIHWPAAWADRIDELHGQYYGQ